MILCAWFSCPPFFCPKSFCQYPPPFGCALAEKRRRGFTRIHTNELEQHKCCPTFGLHESWPRQNAQNAKVLPRRHGFHRRPQSKRRTDRKIGDRKMRPGEAMAAKECIDRRFGQRSGHDSVGLVFLPSPIFLSKIFLSVPPSVAPWHRCAFALKPLFVLFQSFAVRNPLFAVWFRSGSSRGIG